MAAPVSLEAPASPDEDTAAAGGAVAAFIGTGSANGQGVVAIIHSTAQVVDADTLDAPSSDSPDGPPDAAFNDRPIIPLSVLSPAEITPRPYVPKPKPPIVPERFETGWRTTGVLIERATGGYYITVQQAPPRGPNRIYVKPAALDKIIALATGPIFETGKIWKALCDIPLERPLPSRQLEEELKLLLCAFANEIRR